jgi:hypothetical protein
MLKSLTIENFRCLKNFKLDNLSRINLLVGKNNSGKTSLLEAITLLQSDINIQHTLDKILSARNEFSNSDKKEFNPAIFFKNFRIDPKESKIIIQADSQKTSKILEIFIDFVEYELAKTFPALSFCWKDRITDTPDKANEEILFPFVKTGVININNMTTLNPKTYFLIDFQEIINRDELFVTANFFSRPNLISLYKQISTTKEEKKIIKILQSLEPEIEDLAIGENDDFVVGLANIERQVQIGSLGDGIYRLLGLALAIVNVKNGVLLVDEIDTGLHYTAMDDMWKMIWQTANDLNVQVFATTHSNDCWKSLAELAETLDDHSDGIAIHYIDKNREHSISYSEQEMIIAAEKDYEVRGV